MGQIIRLNEQELHQIIEESVRQTLIEEGFFDDVWSGVKTGANAVGNAAAGVGRAVARGAQGVGRAVGNAGRRTINNARKEWAPVAQQVDKYGRKIGNAAVTAAKQTGRQIGNAATALGKGAYEAGRRGVNVAGAGLKANARNIKNIATTPLDVINNYGRADKTLKRNIAGAVQGYQDVYNAATGRPTQGTATVKRGGGVNNAFRKMQQLRRG